MLRRAGLAEEKTGPSFVQVDQPLGVAEWRRSPRARGGSSRAGGRRSARPRRGRRSGQFLQQRAEIRPRVGQAGDQRLEPGLDRHPGLDEPRDPLESRPPRGGAIGSRAWPSDRPSVATPTAAVARPGAAPSRATTSRVTRPRVIRTTSMPRSSSASTTRKAADADLPDRRQWVAATGSARRGAAALGIVSIGGPIAPAAPGSNSRRPAPGYRAVPRT